MPVREQHDDDLPAALEVIDQALEKSPQLPEALFNRALALERLFLRASAKKAWQEYLEVDDSSPWAREARERLAAIEVPVFPDPVRIRAEIAAIAADGDRAALAEIVLRQRHLARRAVQEDLLPGWADNWLGGNAAEAGRKLASARAIASEWEAQTSDPTLLAAVAEVEGVSPREREKLAQAHQALGVAARAFAAFDLATVRKAADRALEELPADSPAAPWARVHRLACVYYLMGDVQSEADELLDQAGDDLTSRGAALWIRGLWRAKRGDVTFALADQREAFAAFERLEEHEPTVWLRLLIGEAYGYMGASGLGWQHRRAAMRDVATLTDRKRPFGIFLGSAIVALAEGRPRVAADLLDEAFAMPASMEPHEAVQAFLWRSRIEVTLGQRRDAAADFVRASTWFPKLQSVDAVLFEPELHFVRGLLATDPQDAIAALSRAVVEFRQSGQQRRLPDVLLARAQAQQRAGRYGAADEDLRQAAVLHQQQQGAGYSQQLWAPLLDRPARLFGERVRLAIRDGRAEEAFAVAEGARARVFLADRDAAGAVSLANRPVGPLRLADVRSRLEAGSTMLFFAVLQDRIAQWRVERHRSSVAMLPITPDELARWATAFEADLEADVWTGTTRELAMRLYAALIGPAHLGNGPLIVVPDGELHGLPFAALIDPATKRFLVEDRPVTVSPSATAYLVARDRLRAIGLTPPVDAFVVGDPRVSATLFPGLHPLPGAWEEARAVAALYPRRVLLLRGAATRAALIDALGRHQVVHFAGHAVINRTDPERSSLPLADDGEPGGSLLFGTDIAALDLGSTRAVVLSGCDTASGKVLAGEGPLSLARAFLAAGVPSVVASLWPIADQPAAPLMTAFHQRLRRGEPPAAALRSAQLTVLRSSAAAQRSPAVWASLQAFGG
ncbi:MAG TPA: CHAT domain-containing protein [Thermoanaerobaculia bacterium]|nr:CHAT domain-containing protein [Thermoanaerobaculia bacterium]